MIRKTAFFDEWSWFKFSNLGFALGTNLKFYTIVAKGLKLKVKRFWRLIPTFVEVTGEKLVGMAFLPSPLPILNRVNLKLEQLQKTKKTLKFILFDNYFPDLFTEVQIWY